MSSYATALGGHGARPTIQYEGRTYTFAALDQAAKSAFERRLIDEAMRAAAMAPGAHAEAAISKVVQDAARGVYAFFGDIAQQAVESPSGMIALTGILLGVTDDEAIRLAAEVPLEVAGKLDLVILESLPRDVREKTLKDRERKAREAAEKAAQEATADPTQPAQASA